MTPSLAGCHRVLLASLAITGFLDQPAAGQDLYAGTVDIDGAETITIQSDDILDFIDTFKTESLQALDDSFRRNSDVIGTLNIRGMGAVLVRRRSSTDVSFTIPEAGVALRFQGETRNQSIEQLVEFLKGVGTQLEAEFSTPSADVLKALIKASPVDPVAGNPNSLQSRLFDRAFGVNSGAWVAHRQGEGDNSGWFTMSGNRGDFRAAGYDVNGIEIGTQFGVPAAAGRVWLVGEVFYGRTKTESVPADMGGGRVGIAWKPTMRFSLTPSVSFGFVGSRSLGSMNDSVSVALSSLWTVYDDGIRVTWANQVGEFNTTDLIALSDTNLRYDLKNYNLRTGMIISDGRGSQDPTSTRRFGWDVHADTQWYLGDPLYVEHSTTIGMNLLYRVAKFTELKFGIETVFGGAYHGLRFQVGATF